MKHPTQPSVHNSTRESTSLKYNQQRPTPPSQRHPNNFLVPTPSETQNLQNEPTSSITKNFDTSRTPHPTPSQDFSKIPRRHPTRSSVLKTNNRYSASILTPQVAPLTPSGPKDITPALLPKRSKSPTSVIITHPEDSNLKSQLLLQTGTSTSNLDKS